MRSTVLLAAALARIVTATPAPAPAPQNFDFAAILKAPTPDVVGPPQTAVFSVTSTVSINKASLAASISSAITKAATASITGAAASAASTQIPSIGLSKRQGGTSTSSSITACPTTVQAGEYCGFVDPSVACAPQPPGSGPLMVPDTPDVFLAYPKFTTDAMSAVTPKGYTNVFKNMNAANNANSYLTYSYFTSYDVKGCAAFCDSTPLCTSFNIYVERDPSLNPSANGDSLDAGWGNNCPNPPSLTNYKCSLWGSNIDATSATNFGQFREQFQNMVAASNGYDKTNTTTPSTVPGWKKPSKMPGGISSGGSYFIGSNFYPGPYDPSICAIYAQAQTDTNKQVAVQQGNHSYTPANMFNSYMVHKNGIAQGTYCQLYNTPLSTRYASFLGAWSGGDFFGVRDSWTYSLSTQLSGKL